MAFRQVWLAQLESGFISRAALGVVGVLRRLADGLGHYAFIKNVFQCHNILTSTDPRLTRAWSRRRHTRLSTRGTWRGRRHSWSAFFKRGSCAIR